MGYSKEIYNAAIDSIKQKANANKQKYDRNKQALYSKYPELKNIETEIMTVGASLGITALSGDKTSLKLMQEKLTLLANEKRDIYKKEGFCEYTPICKNCNDTGFKDDKYCSCVKEEAKLIAFKLLNDGISLENYGFDKFDINLYPLEYKNGMQKVLDFCKDYAFNFKCGNNLLLTGKTGLGKTHLSLSIAKEVINKNYSVIYGPSDNIFSKIEKEHFSYSSSTPYKDSVLNCDLLIIDDLGTEFLTKYTLSTLYNIVNNRLINNKSTIISTNFTIDEIEEKYSERILSRLTGAYTIKLLMGNDIRQIKAK